MHNIRPKDMKSQTYKSANKHKINEKISNFQTVKHSRHNNEQTQVK